MLYKKSEIYVRAVLIAFVVSGLTMTAFGNEGSGGKGMHLKFSSDSKPVTVTVTGKVTDKRSGEPIADALVRGHIAVWLHRGPELFDKWPYEEVRTDSAGVYELEFVTALTTQGSMKGKDGLCVYASAPGYETKAMYAKARVTVDNSEFRDFDFALGRGKTVKGVVVDEAGDPVEGALVRVQNGMNGDWNHFGSLGQTVTDDIGYFELRVSRSRNTIGSNPWLTITSDGHGTGLFWDVLKKANLGTLVIDGCGDISGKVVDGSGNPVANCEVQARGWPVGLIDKVQTDDKGMYLLRGVPGKPSIIDFYKRKNTRYVEGQGKVTVYARVNPAMNLRDVPQYEIMAADGETITGPELVVGSDSSVSGKLVASGNPLSISELMVRLDNSWDNMVRADDDGGFCFPFVSAGKHRLTVYLPHNLRGDRGIGRVEIDVQEGRSLSDVEIQLDSLAEVRVQFLDADGNPLEGVTAGATWTKSGEGFWTEGTISDADGRAILYLYAGQEQYVRGFDRVKGLVAEGYEAVKPAAGDIIERLQIVMVPAGQIGGLLQDSGGNAVADKALLCTTEYADEAVTRRKIETDAHGRFEVGGLAPGILKLSFEADSVVFENVLGDVFELKPGENKELGTIVLEDGFDRNAIAREKEANAIENPEEVLGAAEQFFEMIKSADYEYFGKKEVHWSEFPIVGHYQTYKWFDVLVEWMCKTFEKNPIVSVKLGKVFANPEAINGKEGLPTVPYKLTLKDGMLLEGYLPFEYNFDGGKGHWHGLHGIDWHLRK